MKLAYNDNTIFDTGGGTQGTRDKDVDALLHYLIVDQKAPVSILGIQSHMGGGNPLVPAPVLIQNLDHWATYHLPIEITEYDASVQDDAAHGRYQNEFMTAIFSCPQISSFVQWGFWAGSHWLAKQGGAMYRQDWTPRPAAQVYERLLFHDWWTDTRGRTNSNGRYQTRAFLGSYQLTATQGGKTRTLHADVTKNQNSMTTITVSISLKSIDTALFLATALIALLSPSSQAQEYNPAPTAHQFPYVGAALGVHARLEKVPGRKFLDFAGKPIDPVKFLAANGFNAVRVGGVSYGQPLTTTSVDNADVDHRELNFGLDWGGVDRQVATARRACALGEKVALTIQFGQDLGPESWHEYIPRDMLGLTYGQTLHKIDVTTRLLLDQFLNAGIQPNIIICENEAESGMLFQYADANGKMAIRDRPDKDVFSDSATGIYSIVPKYAGYFKQEILSAKANSKNAVSTRPRRALPCTRQRILTVPAACSTVCSTIPSRPESVYYDKTDHPVGIVTAVPPYLRNVRLADLVDIMGFSFYPGLPKDGTQAGFAAALAGKNGSMDLTDDLAYINTIIPTYGRYTSGPWKRQYKKQVLVRRIRHRDRRGARLRCGTSRSVQPSPSSMNSRNTPGRSAHFGGNQRMPTIIGRATPGPCTGTRRTPS